jgi:hypothetical protein
MTKGDKSFQAVGLGLLIVFFSWLAFGDFSSIQLINAILQAYKPIFLAIIGCLAMPTIFALILEARSNGREYEDKPYYNFLKATIHLIFVVITILIFGVIFAFLYVFSSLFIKVGLSWILVSIITLSLYSLFWIWIEKTFGKKIFGFFSYTS